MVNINRSHFNNFPQEEDPANNNLVESSSSDSEDEDELVEIYLEQRVQLRQIFELDAYGCYGMWCLFLAAAKHQNWEELLIPIPPCHDNGRFNINLLLHVIDQTPKLDVMHDTLLDGNYAEYHPIIIELLHSVFIEMGEQVLHTISNNKFQKVIKFCGLNMNALCPTDVFELRAADLEEMSGFRDNRKFGFYGTSPARFYSILINGFMNSMKTETEDEPVEAEHMHLTTDFSVSLSHSDKEPYWYDLRSGAVFRCVALCEYIDCSDWVQYKKEPNQEHTDIIISNTSALRVQLIMFFKEIPPALHPDEPFEILNNTHRNEKKSKEQSKKTYLTIGCCFAAGMSLYCLYQQNALGLKTFVDCQFNQLLQKFAVSFSKIKMG